MRAFVLSFGSLVAASAAFGAPASQVTFYKDVLPVLQKDCQECHRPGEAAPMSFLTYDSTRPWAKAIKTAVLTKKMPPWFADPHYGKFSDDRSLSQAEIDTLVAWADNGSVAGKESDGPKPISWLDGWRIQKPDMIIKMPVAFNVPSSGTIDYEYVIIPTGFTEDKYVQMAEARPGDRAVVHHILAFIREPGSSWLKGAPVGTTFTEGELRKQMEEQMRAQAAKNGGAPGGRGARRGGDGGGASFGDEIAGYAPGTPANIMKPGQVKLIPAGSDIVLQIHYTATGKPATDASEVGIVFATTKPTERVLTLAATTTNFAIPPGAPNYEVDSKIQLQDDSTLLSMLPHMHFRGKSFEFRAVYPSGEKETLLSVPHYDFNWQLSYDLASPKLLPKGTVIECTAHYDNSVDNKANPDATKEVHYGEQTWEEMMFGFFDVSVPLNKTAIDLMVPEDKRPKAQNSSAALE